MSNTGTILDSLLAAMPSTTVSTVELDQWRSQVGPAIPNFASRPPVPNSEDLERVLALPRRPQVDLSNESPMAQALVQLMNERLRRPDWQRRDCKCESMGRHCITTLQPSQAWALYEAPIVGGLLGSIRAGGGKTALNFLLPMVLPCKQVVLLIPPKLKLQLIREYELWREHWQVPNLMWGKHEGHFFKQGGRPTVHVIPYSLLSRPESTKLLKDHNPDLVLADEMHQIASRTSARGIRFLRFYGESAKHARFAGYTGTITDKSLNEYCHLSALALREGSPVPLDPRTAASWALALDPSDRPAEPGALRKLCEPGEELESGFRRRLVETVGVVATKEGLIGSASLNIFEYPSPDVPEEVLRLLDMVRGGERPDGEELVDALEVAKNARELASGLYLRWKFLNLPRDASGKVTPEGEARVKVWRARRKAWRSEMREKLKHQEEHLDSQQLLEEAAQRAYQKPAYQGELPVWYAQHYLAWMAVESTVEYKTEAVWVDDFWALECAKWAKKHRGIVWYEHKAFGERVAELSGCPLHSGGPDAEERIKAEKGDRSIIASIKSHGEGRDGLQFLFNEQLVANPPASGKKWEQLLARLERVGQRADEVNTWVPRHVPEMADAIDRAVSRAKYVYGTWGSDQRLLNANCDFDFRVHT